MPLPIVAVVGAGGVGSTSLSDAVCNALRQRSGGAPAAVRVVDGAASLRAALRTTDAAARKVAAVVVVGRADKPEDAADSSDAAVSQQVADLFREAKEEDEVAVVEPSEDDTQHNHHQHHDRVNDILMGLTSSPSSSSGQPGEDAGAPPRVIYVLTHAASSLGCEGDDVVNGDFRSARAHAFIRSWEGFTRALPMTPTSPSRTPRAAADSVLFVDMADGPAYANSVVDAVENMVHCHAKSSMLVLQRAERHMRRTRRCNDEYDAAGQYYHQGNGDRNGCTVAVEDIEVDAKQASLATAMSLLQRRISDVRLRKVMKMTPQLLTPSITTTCALAASTTPKPPAASILSSLAARAASLSLSTIAAAATANINASSTLAAPSLLPSGASRGGSLSGGARGFSGVTTVSWPSPSSLSASGMVRPWPPPRRHMNISRSTASNLSMGQVNKHQRRGNHGSNTSRNTSHNGEGFRGLGLGRLVASRFRRSFLHRFLRPRDGAAILWFRSDLRVDDNAVLHAASSLASVQANGLLPVYIFDPRDYTRGLGGGFEKAGPTRAKFVIECVHALRASLRALGSDLIVRVGRPEEQLADLAELVGARKVFCHAEPTTDERDTEAKVTANLIQVGQGCELVKHWGGTLFDPEDLPFPIQETPASYSEFRNTLESVAIREPIQTPERVPALPSVPGGGVDSGELPTVQSLSGIGIGCSVSADATGTQPRIHGSNAPVGGERAALRVLRELSDKAYLSDTDRTEFSCRVSPWLALGCVSPRRVYHELRAKYSTKSNDDDVPLTGLHAMPQSGLNRMSSASSSISSSWVSLELLWRDFFRFVTAKHTTTSNQTASSMINSGNKDVASSGSWRVSTAMV